jgi:hypothetical protein
LSSHSSSSSSSSLSSSSSSYSSSSFSSSSSSYSSSSSSYSSSSSSSYVYCPDITDCLDVNNIGEGDGYYGQGYSIIYGTNRHNDRPIFERQFSWWFEIVYLGDRWAIIKYDIITHAPTILAYSFDSGCLPPVSGWLGSYPSATVVEGPCPVP